MEDLTINGRFVKLVRVEADRRMERERGYANQSHARKAYEKLLIDKEARDRFLRGKR